MWSSRGNYFSSESVVDGFGKRNTASHGRREKEESCLSEEFERAMNVEEIRGGRLLELYSTLTMLTYWIGILMVFFYKDWLSEGVKLFMGENFIIAFLLSAIFFITVGVLRLSRRKSENIKVSITDIGFLFCFGEQLFQLDWNKVLRVMVRRDADGKVVKIALFELKKAVSFAGFEEMELIEQAILQRVDDSKVNVDGKEGNERPLLHLTVLLIPLSILACCQIFFGTIFPILFIISPFMLHTIFIVLSNYLARKQSANF